METAGIIILGLVIAAIWFFAGYEYGYNERLREEIDETGNED